MTSIYPKQGTEFEGAVPALVHLLITKRDKFFAMREAFYRQNLPNVTSLLATCLFVLIVVSFQGLSFVLPVRTHIPGFQVNYLIKISTIYFGPIILHRLLVSFLYKISKVIANIITYYVTLILFSLPVQHAMFSVSVCRCFT
jgi:protein transport protein SEC61 subunit alpha